MRWVVPILLVTGCAHHQATSKDARATAPVPVASRPAAAPTMAPATETATSTTCGALRVHFAFNSALLDEGDKPALENAARCLKNDRAMRFDVEGNADERGTEEYNLALGDRRARVVADYLRALGVSTQQLRPVSYGKERPICPDHTDACWSENRRADLSLPRK